MTFEALDDRELAETWTLAWADLGRAPPVGLQQEVLRAWNEPQRHYHDERHLRECLALWMLWRGQCKHPGEVAIALWFHDAVYDPQASDNELNSAAWAARSFGAAGIDSDAAQRVFKLILATAHDGDESREAGANSAVSANVSEFGIRSGDEKAADSDLLLDIDLAILGSPPERFSSYEADVRQEYAWVPQTVYQEKRVALLQRFVDRPRLYRSAPAFEMFEAQARINLSEAVLRLSQ